jgi:hypothetical protein
MGYHDAMPMGYHEPNSREDSCVWSGSVMSLGAISSPRPHANASRSRESVDAGEMRTSYDAARREGEDASGIVAEW